MARFSQEQGRVSLKDRVGSGWSNPTHLFLFSISQPPLSFLSISFFSLFSFLSHSLLHRSSMAKNKSSCLSSACHSPLPLITTTSGGGFSLARPSLASLSWLLSSFFYFGHKARYLSFSLMVLKGEFKDGVGWFLGEPVWVGGLCETIYGSWVLFEPVWEL